MQTASRALLVCCALTAQVVAGDYDGIFLDSASPALLQGETQADPRLAGTGVRATPRSRNWAGKPSSMLGTFGFKN
jgi:hypothetical protein